MATLPEKRVRALMRNRALKRQLEAVGRRVMARAEQITRDEGGSAEFTLESGIRPGGRAFTNVVSSSAAEEYGNDRMRRRRALGRATREV